LSKDKIVIGSDHAGFWLKSVILNYVKELGYDIDDIGTYSSESVDYPEYGKKVGENVSSGLYDLGIAICGTGVGIGIAASKVSGIRVCTCSEPYSAKMSREHNNANVLTFGSRVVGSELSKMIVKAWLEASFDGERHSRRVRELNAEDQNDNELFNELIHNVKD